MTQQVKTIEGHRYSFNGWMPTRDAVRRYQKEYPKRHIRSFHGRSSTGKLGYLVYVRG